MLYKDNLKAKTTCALKTAGFLVRKPELQIVKENTF